MTQHTPGAFEDAQSRDVAELETVDVVDVTTITSQGFWLTLADKVVKTFFQALLTFVGVGVSVFDLNWPAALEASAYAAGISALIGLSLAVIPETGNLMVDAGGRIARTFVGAFAGALPATAVSFGAVDWRAAVALGATAATLSLLTAVGQFRIAGRIGPAL